LHVRLSLSEITSLFGLSRYLDRTFAQRIGSAKVKSKVKSSGVLQTHSCTVWPAKGVPAQLNTVYYKHTDVCTHTQVYSMCTHQSNQPMA